MESRLEPGQNLLHYRLTAKIGEGGMGVVWQARDTKLDRDVAIKLLPAELASNAQRRMRFEREARAVAALNHPNIVTLYSVEHVPAEGDAPGLSFLTMELVTGQPLAEAIGSNGLDYDRFLTLALPMAEALGRAHRAGIVHRDIKTANVVLNNDGAPKILDFGLARLDRDDEIETDEIESDATVTELSTRVGTVLGTPAYMAPEQARGHSADARSDIFSLGSVFYELLTGRRPFQRDSYEQSIQALLHDEPESVTSASRKVPRELESILRKCLAKEPDQRYANGDALHDALSAVRERQLATAGGNAWWRRPVVVLPLLIVALVAVGWVVRDRMKAAEAHRVRTELLPRIEQLLEQRAGFEPLMLALEAQRKLPGDPAVNKLVEAASVPVRVTSQPDGAAISIHSYMDVDSAGAIRCNTPCDIRVPPSYLVFRA